MNSQKTEKKIPAYSGEKEEMVRENNHLVNW